jgi:hypothetical protein
MSRPWNLIRPPTILPMLDGRLAAAGFADDAHRLAGHNCAGEIHDGRYLAAPREEGDGEVLDLDDRLGVFDVRGFDGFVHLGTPVSLSSIVRAARRRED